MRTSIIAILLSAAALAACGKDTPDPASLSPTEATVLPDVGGRPGFGPRFGGLFALRRLPDDLALTSDQKTQIRALLDSWHEANQADLQKVRATMEQVRSARRQGGAAADAKSLFQDLKPIRERLRTAGAELKTQVDGVLSDQQKSWLAENTPKRCDASSAPALSDEQKQQIHSLVEGFRQANATDLGSLRTAMQQAHEARRAGGTRADFEAAMQQVKPAMDRLKTAHEQLRSQIQGVLTAEQKASGCLPGLRPMGGFGHGMRGFGPGAGGLQPSGDFGPPPGGFGFGRARIG